MDDQQLGQSSACPACNGTRLQAGQLIWNGPIRFKRDGLKLLFRRGPKVRAAARRAGGHISLSVDPEKIDD